MINYLRVVKISYRTPLALIPGDIFPLDKSLLWAVTKNASHGLLVDFPDTLCIVVIVIFCRV